METVYKTDFLDLYHCDCLDLMKQYPDNYYSLALVDPPYGLDFTKYNRVSRATDGTTYISNNYKKGSWDNETPTKEYFDELFRISKNQIVWGGNYFEMPPCQCFIFWYKQNPVPNFADGEYAWTSFKKPAMCIDYRYYGNLQGKGSSTETKIHPTQKPIELYANLLKLFCKQGDKILDTHFGSGSIALAVDRANRLDNMNLHLTACEIDLDYVNASIKRISENIKQGTFSF